MYSSASSSRNGYNTSQSCMGPRQGIVHQAILGDLNTMGHGIARLSRRHCTDALRFRSLGSYEAEVWHACVLSQMDPDYAADGPPPGASAPATGPPHGSQFCRQEDTTSARTEVGTAGGRARHAGGWQAGLAPGAEGGDAGSSGGAAARSGAGAPGARVNPRLRRWGVSEAVCRDVLNPGATCDAFVHRMRHAGQWKLFI